MILALVALGLLRDSIIPAPQYRGIDGRIRVEIPRVEAEVAVDGSLAGYGGSYVEPESFRFRGVRRLGDGFFLKASYLFRL